MSPLTEISGTAVENYAELEAVHGDRLLIARVQELNLLRSDIAGLPDRGEETPQKDASFVGDQAITQVQSVFRWMAQVKASLRTRENVLPSVGG